MTHHLQVVVLQVILACTSVALDSVALLELVVEKASLLLAALASPLMQLRRLFMTRDCVMDLVAACDDDVPHSCSSSSSSVLLSLSSFWCCCAGGSHAVSGVVFLLLFAWIHGGMLLLLQGCMFCKEWFFAAAWLTSVTTW